MVRLKTEIRVAAWRRRCQAGGAFATVLRKGDTDAGMVAIRAYRSGGGETPITVWMETRDMDGNEAWRDISKGGMSEADADEALARQTRFDPDLWIVEVEDREGRAFLDGNIIE